MLGLIIRIAILYFVVMYLIHSYNLNKMSNDQIKAELIQKALELKQMADTSLKPFLVQTAQNLKQNMPSNIQQLQQTAQQTVNANVTQPPLSFEQLLSTPGPVASQTVTQKPKVIMEQPGQGFKPFCPLVPPGQLKICKGEYK